MANHTRTLVAGVGINDANYATSIMVNGKQVRCEFYRCWSGMLQRCYNEKVIARNPSYNGCSVCPEWLVFSNFKAWMEKQDWVGKQLDKDILIPGNKVYSPETCAFVTAKTNTMFERNESRRGGCPLGVSRTKAGTYFAACRGLIKAVALGTFPTPGEAHAAWQWEKAGVLWALSKQQTNPRVASAIALRAAQLVDDALAGRESMSL